MSHSKPLLIPWLRAHIDSGRYPGVQWTNLEQTEFTIPWKHALRQDSSDADVLIFKAWAEVSGNGQAHGDASVWKRNFRSALRAKGFKLVSDNKNDNANPHKVFHWPDESVSRANSSGGSQDRDDSDLVEGVDLQEQEIRVVFCPSPLENTFFLAESSASQDILHDCLQGLNIGPETEGSAGFELPPEQQHLQTPVVIGGYALPGQQQDPVMCEGAVGEAQLPEQPACPMEMAEGGASGEQLAEQFLQTMSRNRDGDHFKTQFRLSVFYRGVKVLEQLVENERGFRLIFRPEFTGMVLDQRDQSGLTLVSLPSPKDMLDQIQNKLTQCILDKLGDGLDFGVSGHVVYAQRRGEIKAFWSLSKFDRSRKPQEIPKLQPERLYQFKDFFGGILDFIDGGESPPCSLFLCLGEKWPDPDNRPWMKKLITVEVVLTSMELLKNIAVSGGASSLNSVELQMSLGEMMEME